MPVTVKSASHGASKTWYKSSGLHSLLDISHIARSFFAYDKLTDSNVIVSANDFVHTAIHAHRESHHLSVRPEDVWFAILSQLNIWSNAKGSRSSLMKARRICLSLFRMVQVAFRNLPARWPSKSKRTYLIQT